MATKITIVRHGEAEGNVKKFFQGTMETDLTERGIKQTEYAAGRLKDEPFDIIYSSGLKRTLDTAAIINKYHNIEIIPEMQLAEIDGGEFEGKYWEEIFEKYPEQGYNWKNNLASFSAPGGESIVDVCRRMNRAVTDIAEKNHEKNICIISHGCAIKCFLCTVEFGSAERIEDVGWSNNTSVSQLEYENGKFRIIYKNSDSHLPKELNTAVTNMWK